MGKEGKEHISELQATIQELSAKLREAEKKIVELNEQKSAFRDISRLFTMSLNLLESVKKKDVLGKIVEHAANLVGSDTSAIYLINKNIVRLVVTFPPLPDDFPDEFRNASLNNHKHIKKVIDTKKLVIVPDTKKATLTKEERIIVETKNLGSIIYIPLVVDNRVEGVIILGTVNRVHHFEKHEIDLFTTFSNITSLALENSHLFENLILTKEKAEESNRLKTAFLHNISHEIRTPLNAIIGFAGLMGQADLTDERKIQYNQIISQANNQLLAIIDDIINISHIETGQIVKNESETNINLILNNLHRQYLPEARKKGIDYKISTSCSGPDGIIITDENKVISILTNLLNNAFKFTHAGSIELGCFKHGDMLGFTVSDTGIGIPESEHERIFDRFYQAEKSDTTLYGGLGLGLSIASAYVRLLGGQFELESAPGTGSKFSFTIPYRNIQETKNENHYPENDQNSVVTGKTILVAEDEDSNYAFVQTILDPLGYKIIRAFNGSDAIDLCVANPHINMVLMDIRMPVKNGYESTAEILKFRPELPIVAQTAYSYPKDRANAIDKGCIDYIAKPFSKDQLISMVRKYT
ncbi:MAG: response regulator [Bacteroidales bacterium]|nr:response regulator [Bacteroidales bacterium]